MKGFKEKGCTTHCRSSVETGVPRDFCVLAQVQGAVGSKGTREESEGGDLQLHVGHSEVRNF